MMALQFYDVHVVEAVEKVVSQVAKVAQRQLWMMLVVQTALSQTLLEIA